MQQQQKIAKIKDLNLGGDGHVFNMQTTWNAKYFVLYLYICFTYVCTATLHPNA